MALIQSLEELQAIRSAQSDSARRAGTAAGHTGSAVYGAYTGEDTNSFSETLRQKSGRAGKYDNIFSEASRTYGISKNLLQAVAEVESGFDATAVSRAGAQGVMQLMPSTARYLGVENAFDPYQNIMAGAKLLRDNIRQFGSVPLALAAYNAGPDAVQKYGGVPPYTETQNYVTKIMGMLGSGDYRASNSYNYSGSADRNGVYLDVGTSSTKKSGSGETVNLLLSDYNYLLTALLTSSLSSGLSTGLSSGILSGLSGTSSLGSASLLNSSLYSSLLSGNTYNALSGILGNNASTNAGIGSVVGSIGALPNAGAKAEASEEGEEVSGEAAGTSSSAAGEATVTMSKEDFQNLVELLRIQMLMTAGSNIGGMAET